MVHIPHHVLFLILQLFHIPHMLYERVTGLPNLEEHGQPDINTQVHPTRLPAQLPDFVEDCPTMKILERTVQSLLLCLFFTHVDAFWRMVCSTIQTGRIDPIVNPGAVSGHAHTVAGPISKPTPVFHSIARAHLPSRL
jgi:hypothetical protein